jgi:hypothetical protein
MGATDGPKETLNGVENTDVRLVLKEIQIVQQAVSSVKDDSLPRIEKSLEKLNGTVRRNSDLLAEHDKRVFVLERFCDQQVSPALAQIIDNRVDIAVLLAKIAAGGLSVGAGAMLIGKVFGAF